MKKIDISAPGWRNGRRKGLKILRGFPRAGSSPAPGTILRISTPSGLACYRWQAGLWLGKPSFINRYLFINCLCAWYYDKKVIIAQIARMINKLSRLFLILISVFNCLAFACHCPLVRTGNEQFTTESLKNFLVTAYNEQKIIDPAFARENCLIVENLAGQGGVLTGQLFLVKSVDGEKEQEYIVKELIAGEKEIFDLTLVANYKPLHPYIAPSFVKDSPIILLPIAYLYYTLDDKDYYFSVMPKAHGQEFLKIMNMYVADPTQENKKKLQRAYATLGRTLANFHKAFMEPDQKSLKGNTLVHGDFHVRNFFYDAATDTIYWIDNECLGAATVHRQSILVDIQDSLLKPFHEFNWFGFDENIRAHPEPWVEMFYPIFFENYLNAFGGDKKVHVGELKNILAQIEDFRLRELSDLAILLV